MPIENSIDNLAAAINALAAAISGKAGATPTPVATNAAKLADTPRGTTQAEGAADAKAAVREKRADSSDAKPGYPIDFETQIRKPIVAMAGGGRRDVALKILSSFGAAKVSEIKPEDYEAAVAAIVAAG